MPDQRLLRLGRSHEGQGDLVSSARTGYRTDGEEDAVSRAIMDDCPPPDIGLPPGTPHWITTDLITQTLRVWQPLSRRHLTEEDAVTILLNIGHLYEAVGLLEREDDEPP